MTSETLTAADLTMTLHIGIDAFFAASIHDFDGNNVLLLDAEQTALCEFQTRPSHKRSDAAKTRVKAVLTAARKAAKRLGAPVRIVGVVDLLPMYGGRQWGMHSRRPCRSGPPTRDSSGCLGRAATSRHRWPPGRWA